jgi:hypothetical protein
MMTIFSLVLTAGNSEHTCATKKIGLSPMATNPHCHANIDRFQIPTAIPINNRPRRLANSSNGLLRIAGERRQQIQNAEKQDDEGCDSHQWPNEN